MTLPAVILAALLQAAPAAAASPAAKPSRPPCIQLSESSDTEYVRVNDHTIVVRSGSRWWKLTTTPSSLMLMPQAFLVNDIHGPASLCSRLDFQLSVVDPPGAREGLIVQDFQAITADEGKALRHAARR